MSPAEQEFLSRRYAFPRFTLGLLSTGEVAIATGFNPPHLLHTCPPSELADYLCNFIEAHEAETEARLQAVATFTLDFDEIDLSEIGL